MIRRLPVWIDRMASEEERSRTTLALAEGSAPAELSAEDRRLMIQLLRGIPGSEAASEARRFEVPKRIVKPPPPPPPSGPSPEELLEAGDWLAAYRAIRTLEDPEGAWNELRGRLMKREGWSRLQILLQDGGDFPALDAYCEKWPRRFRRVAQEAVPLVLQGGQVAPFPGRTRSGAWEIMLPAARAFVVEVPLPEGPPLSIIVAPPFGDEPVRVPVRVPDEMTLIPGGEGIDVPFFIDWTECPGRRVREFLRERPEDLAWLTRRFSSGVDFSEPDLPVLLRKDQRSFDAWKTATSYADSWERKAIPRVEEWKAATRLWVDLGGMRRANLNREKPAVLDVDSEGSGGAGGISHLLGNAWEILEGRHVAGGGTESLPWRIGRNPLMLLDRTLRWDEEVVQNVGFRMVLRLASREEDGS
ncbi:MAG: hypothetical protein O6952_01600, partial [Planctomycetota bacterium]|nr:hypothetical protein [Planctomycetota bacterium]